MRASDETLASFALWRQAEYDVCSFRGPDKFLIQLSEETQLNATKWFVACSSLFLGFLFFVPAAQAQIDDAIRKLSHDIFKELIEINSTDSVGSVTAASEATAQRGWESTGHSCCSAILM